mgnify:CR=1 FL=1
MEHCETHFYNFCIIDLGPHYLLSRIIILGNKSMANLRNSIVLLFLLIQVATAQVAKEQNFEKALQGFITAFNNKDVVTLNQFVHREGFYVLDNPGAMIVVKKVSTFDELLSFPGEYDAARLKVIKVAEKPSRKSHLPKFDCNKDSGWEFNGAFYARSSYKKISTLLKNYKDSEIVEVKSSQISEAKKIEKRITNGFVDTKNNVVFYFGRTSGRWILYVIDAVTPCSA